MSGVIRTILPMAPVPTTDVEIAGLYQGSSFISSLFI